MKNFTIKHVLPFLATLLVIVAFDSTEVQAQWEKIFDKATNNNDSPGEYFIEGDTILIGRNGGGLYFSHNQGETWNEESVKPDGSSNTLDMFFKFKGKYYAHWGYTGVNNFIQSDGDFTEWKLVESLPQRTNGDYIGLSQVTTNGEVILYTTFQYVDDEGNIVTDLLYSEDGEHWVNLGVSPGYSYYTFLGTDLFAAAGPRLMHSSDTAKTWNQVMALNDTLRVIKLHTGGTSVYAVARNIERDQYFLFRWDVGSTEWHKIFEISSMIELRAYVDNERVGVTSFSNGMYYSTDSGQTWASIGTEEVKPVSVYLSGDYFYTTTPGSLFGTDLVRIHLSNFTTFTSNEAETERPLSIKLNPNYPNPFNPTTNISYEISKPGNVELRVFDITGREIAVLENSFKAAGAYSVTADLSNFSSGIYFYQLSSNGAKFTRKMTLLK